MLGNTATMASVSDLVSDANPEHEYLTQVRTGEGAIIKTLELTAKGEKRLFVKHKYTDQAKREDELVGLRGFLDDRYELPHHSNNKCYKAKSKPSPLFPLKLYMIMGELQSIGKGNIITWLPHGRAFCIRNNDLLVKEVLPEYFKNCKMSSFYRQLNLYGFLRLTTGRDTGAYYHESFLRGRAFLTRHIFRTKVKGTKIRAASSPQDEPDLYAFPPLCQGPSEPEKGPMLGANTSDDHHTVRQSLHVPTAQMTRGMEQHLVNRLSDTILPMLPITPGYNNCNLQTRIMNNNYSSIDPMFMADRFQRAHYNAEHMRSVFNNHFQHNLVSSAAENGVVIHVPKYGDALSHDAYLTNNIANALR